MMKFFRKYTKALLAVFMSLLLLVWLGGSALTHLLRSENPGANEVRATAFGETIKRKDMWSVSPEIGALKALNDIWQQPWIFVLRALGVNPNALQMFARDLRTEPLTEEEWFMLSTEARKDGVYVPADAVESFKSSHGLTPEVMRRIRGPERRSVSEIDQGIHAFLCVQTEAVLACQSVQVSEADIQYFVRLTSERAHVCAVVVAASSYLDAAYKPTAAELTAQLEKYRDTASQPAGGLDFGYQLPEAAQVEYIKITSKALREEADSVEREKAAAAYWQAHKQDFHKPESRPATRPGEPPKKEPYDTFTEAREAVLAQLRSDAANKEAQRIARDLIAQLARPWADAQPSTQPGNYKVPPASETAEDIYRKVVAKWEAKYPGALSHGHTGLLDEQGWHQQRELEQVAAMAKTAQSIPLSRAAFLVAGLEAKPEDDPNHTRYFRSLYETCAEPFTDGGGNAYVFRTVAIRPKQAPASVDAVREKLTHDIQLQRAYDEAGKRASALKDRAGQSGLEVAFRSDKDMFSRLGETSLKNPPAFTRMQVYAMGGGPPFVFPSSLYELGVRDAELPGACFDLAGTTTTQPMRVLAREERREQEWLVVQLLKVDPPTQAEFDKQRASAIDYYRTQRQIQVLANWFDSDQIRARIGWKDAEGYEKAKAARPRRPARTF